MGFREASVPKLDHWNQERPQVRDPGEERVRHRRAHVGECDRSDHTQDGVNDPVLPLPQLDQCARRAVSRVRPNAIQGQRYMVREDPLRLRRQHEAHCRHNQEVRAAKNWFHQSLSSIVFFFFFNFFCFSILNSFFRATIGSIKAHDLYVNWFPLFCFLLLLRLNVLCHFLYFVVSKAYSVHF